MVLVPWTSRSTSACRSSVWRETIEHYYPNTGWVALRAETLEALQREKRPTRPGDVRRVRRASCSTRRAMTDALEQLVDSLLYEGYALYPYTPGATKNATPTPFGIVYPPAYAAECAERVRPRPARVRRRARRRTRVLTAEVRFLAPSGERHRGGRAAGRAAGPVARSASAPDATRVRRRAGVDAALASRAPDGRGARSRCCVHNTRDVRRRARPRRRARALAALDALRRAGRGGRVRLAARSARARASTPTRCSPAPRDDAVRRRDDRAARPPADRAREPRRRCSTRPRSRRRCCSTCRR